MSKVFIEEESLTAIGDAIREKTGDTDLLSVPTGMIEAIASISGGGGEHLKTWNRVKITLTFYSGDNSPYSPIDTSPCPCATLNLSQYINDNNENMWIIVCETTGHNSINSSSSDTLNVGMFSHFLTNYPSDRGTFYGCNVRTLSYGTVRSELVSVMTGADYIEQDRTLFLYWWQSRKSDTPNTNDIRNCYLYYLS